MHDLMFTGIVECQGTIAGREGHRLRVRCPFAAELAVGESVAVSGVCLTVEGRDGETFTATVIPTTLRRTTLGALAPGDPVNLERAVPVGGRLGGHIVQGHVDGVGRLLERRPDGSGEWEVLRFAAPPEVLRYVAPRGAIAVDGVSLTVAERHDDGFSVGIIPHTAARTTLGRLPPGAAVNLEADVVAKYVEAILGAR
jgi:riboflavin synthase